MNFKNVSRLIIKYEDMVIDRKKILNRKKIFWSRDQICGKNFTAKNTKNTKIQKIRQIQ